MIIESFSMDHSIGIWPDSKDPHSTEIYPIFKILNVPFRKVTKTSLVMRLEFVEFSGGTINNEPPSPSLLEESTLPGVVVVKGGWVVVVLVVVVSLLFKFAVVVVSFPVQIYRVLKYVRITRMAECRMRMTTWWQRRSNGRVIVRILCGAIRFTGFHSFKKAVSDACTNYRLTALKHTIAN